MLLSTICELEIKVLRQYQSSRHDSKIWRFHQATRGKEQLQANKSYPRSLNSSRPQPWVVTLLTLAGSFLDILDSLTPLTLKRCLDTVSTGYFWQHQLFSHQLQHVKTIYIFGKSKPSMQLEVSSKSWKSNLSKSNSNLVSSPFTTTLRNLGMRFCLRGEEL
jgi:hypothetical protein